MRKVQETVPDALAGERLDRAVSMAAGVSRAEASSLVADGSVEVDGQVRRRGSFRLVAGQAMTIEISDEVQAGPAAQPAVAVDVVYADRWLLVVEKPAGLVVHPGAGTPDGTLVNGLLAAYPELAGVGDPTRPGIVHRLDKGTSGLLVVARTEEAYAGLVEMLAEHRVIRVYLALVAGRVEADRGVVDAPLARSARMPTRMAVSGGGRPARTNYRVLERLVETTLLECTLETGRTHQIRVHLSAIGHPVVGDDRYGRGAGSSTRRALGLGRPFLHASELAFSHPISGMPVEIRSELPPELSAALESLGGSNVR